VQASGIDVCDGNPHLVIINANTAGGATDIDIYIDNMTQTGGVSTNINADEPFDHTNYVGQFDSAFFAVNFEGSVINHKAVKSEQFEFKKEIYIEAEREQLKSELDII
jgi:hypothetical protein